MMMMATSGTTSSSATSTINISSIGVVPNCPTLTATNVPSSSSSSSNVNHTGMALYACTHCNSRYPFEDLSSGEMLCKDCRNSFIMVKCTYCRSEFQQDSKSNLSSICGKCSQNVKLFGKPTSCEYCNITAAFVGSKCQRCAHSEQKYGPPVPCEQCKQRCAFKRKDINNRQQKHNDKKLLCWLCTMSYKRVLAKARHKEVSLQNSSSKRDHSGRSINSRFKADHGNSNGTSNASNSTSWDVLPTNKKPCVDYVKSFIKTSNGTFLPAPATTTVSSTNSSTSTTSNTQVTSTSIGSSLSMDPTNDIMSVNDNVVAVTQLREKILSLDRQLRNKNQELLKKDVKINELKSEISKEQRECREKIQDMTKKHNERIQELQAKITMLSKQLASLQKTTKHQKNLQQPNLTNIISNNNGNVNNSNSNNSSNLTTTIASSNSNSSFEKNSNNSNYNQDINSPKT